MPLAVASWSTAKFMPQPSFAAHCTAPIGHARQQVPPAPCQPLLDVELLTSVGPVDTNTVVTNVSASASTEGDAAPA